MNVIIDKGLNPHMQWYALSTLPARAETGHTSNCMS